MKEWLIENTLANEEELNQIETEAKEQVRKEKQQAWENFLNPILIQVNQVLNLLGQTQPLPGLEETFQHLIHELRTNREPSRRDVMRTLYKGITLTQNNHAKEEAIRYYDVLTRENNFVFHAHQQVEHFSGSALSVAEIKASYEETPQAMNGYEILNKYFDQLFTRRNDVLAFGEDLGFIGDVNQGFAGLQAKHGARRIFDTGIRELTIMGQGIGLALRGLRPIAEIQYLDYLLYGLQTLSDDLATLHYRSGGRQAAPLIIRTRGHRLEGIWHSGSPLGMIINSLRGIHICVPRNMVQAAGMYNTLLQSNEPGLVIECLNGYRLKENLPTNLSEFTVPLGVPEIVRQGEDITIVSYGSMLRIIEDAANHLALLGISCEVIDVQTLLPFDRNHIILGSLKKTNRIIFIDEDVPGGAAAFMFNKVMEEQGGYRYLDVAPRTLTGTDHRPAYGSDGDYFSKPNAEDIIRVISAMMNE